MNSSLPSLGRLKFCPRLINLSLAGYISCGGLGVVVNVGFPSAGNIIDHARGLADTSKVKTSKVIKDDIFKKLF